MKLPDIKTLNILVEAPHLDGFKILHLSDLHINKKSDINSLKKLVKNCLKESFDILIITGDIIDCKVESIKDKLEVLNELAKNKKSYFISGNHDLVYGLEALKKSLTNFICLDNEKDELLFNKKRVNIVGISDRFSKFFRIKRDEKKVISLLKASSCNIFIAHQPKDYKIALNTNTPLFLCGHTHGGQIYPFGYFVRIFQPFLEGLFYKNKTAIYVNKGLGNWGINFRYKAENEITILNLINN